MCCIDREKKLTDDDKAEIWMSVQKFVREGGSVRGGCVQMAEKLEGSPAKVRGVYNRMKKSGGKVHGNNAFSIEEEQGLLGIIQAFDLANKPLTVATFKLFVLRMNSGKMKLNYSQWKKSFFRRHKKHVVLRVGKNLKGARVDSTTFVKVLDWVEKVESIVAGNGLSWQALVNADETRINLMGDQHKSKLLVNPSRRGGKRPKKASKEGLAASRFATMLPFTRANGEIILVLYVIPLDKNNKDATFWAKEREDRGRGTYPVYYMFSKTGYLQKDQWLAIVKIFNERWKILNPGLTPVLVLDNLRAHRTEEVIDYYCNNGIVALYLVPNTTHFTQPQDDLIFARFKNAINRGLEEKLLCVTAFKRYLGLELFKIAQDMEDMITPAIIRASFRNVGLYPWNKEVIIKNAADNIGLEDVVANPSDDVISKVRTVVLDVLDTVSDTEKFDRLTIRPDLNIVYDSRSIKNKFLEKSEMAEKLKIYKAKSKREKKAFQEAYEEHYFCRGDHYDDGVIPIFPKTKNKFGWFTCERCQNFALCYACREESCWMVSDHIGWCKKDLEKIKKIRKRKRMEEEGSQESSQTSRCLF